MTANGEAITPTVREYAYYLGTDITAELAALGLPPYISDATELQNVYGMLDATAQRLLVEPGYVILSDDGTPAAVGWSYQTVLE